MNNKVSFVEFIPDSRQRVSIMITTMNI